MNYSNDRDKPAEWGCLFVFIFGLAVFGWMYYRDSNPTDRQIQLRHHYAKKAREFKRWKKENCVYYDHSESESQYSHSETWIFNCNGTIYEIDGINKTYISKAPEVK